MSIYQISAFLENRTGQLSEMTGLLASNQIDLRAISIAETSDYGIVRMIADDAKKATAILLDAGHILSMTPVHVISVKDQPGGLAPVLSILAKNNVAVEYMYSLFTHGEDNAYMVFRVSEEDKFEKLMTDNGISVVDADELGLK